MQYQNEHEEAYVSRALTNTETRYAQIGKELLVIMFTLEKFYQFTFGLQVKFQSDHKSLEVILQNLLATALRRLQGMILKAQGYAFSVTYKEGKEMLLADTLPRAYLNEPKKQKDLEHINMLDFILTRKERLEKN